MKNFFLKCVVKGAQWAGVVQRNLENQLQWSIAKILCVYFTCLAWVERNKDNLWYTAKKTASNMIMCVINTFVVTGIFNLGVRWFPASYVKEVVDNNVIYYTIADVNKVQMINYWYLYLPIMLVFFVIICYFECSIKKIGEFSYDKKQNRKKFWFNVFVSFSKVSTLETLFRLFIDTTFNRTWENFFINLLSLGILFIGTVCIHATKDMLVGTGARACRGLFSKGFAKFFVNYFTAMLSFAISFFKVYGDLQFFATESFAMFSLGLNLYFGIYSFISVVIDSNKERLAYISKRKKTTKETLGELLSITKANIIFKVAVNNMYLFVVSFVPTLVGLENTFLWFFKNPYVYLTYLVILLLKGVIEVNFELDELRKFKK